MNIRQRFYQPLSSELVFGFQGEIGYLDAYGDTEQTPFFQNFYAGGPRSLRGFESNTLGPRSTDAPCYEFNYEEGTCPNLVDTNPDIETDENGIRTETGTFTKSVKSSILYMKAIKALQEAQTRIETLEAQNTALTARVTALEP